MSIDIKIIYQKYSDGSSLTDIEAYELRNFMHQLEISIRALGERYHLMWRDIYDLSNRLTDMCKARKLPNLD